MLTKTKLTWFVPVTKPNKFKILDIITGNLTDLVETVLIWSYPESKFKRFHDLNQGFTVGYQLYLKIHAHNIIAALYIIANRSQ